MQQNVGKCVVIHFGSSHKRTDYYLNGRRLRKGEVQRDGEFEETWLMKVVGGLVLENQKEAGVRFRKLVLNEAYEVYRRKQTLVGHKGGVETP